MEDSKDIMWLFKIPMGTCKDFFKIYRQFGQKGSPIVAVARIHTAVWLGYCVVQCMIIHVFEEHSGSVFPGRQKMEAVCSDRNLGINYISLSHNPEDCNLKLNILHFPRIVSLPHLFQTNQLQVLGNHIPYY
jgi:hypothetical protein